MAILGLNIPTFKANNLTQSKNIQAANMTKPSGLKMRIAPQFDEFIPSGKNISSGKIRFVNNYAGTASKEMVNLEEKAKKGGSIEVSNYPNGNIKEKNFFDEKTNISINQTFYANGNPKSEQIREKAGQKWIEIKQSEYYPNGNIKNNEEYDSEMGKHVVQSYYENGNQKSEKLQSFGAFKWNDVRNTEFYSNGNVKNNVEYDVNYGRHISQTFYENGNTKSLDIKKRINGEWTSIQKAEYNQDGSVKNEK